MPRSLVTGATGFIGQHLVPVLREQGDVTLLVREETPPAWDGVRMVGGDVTRQESVTAAMEGAEVVVHMAAVSFVPDAVQDPVGTFEVNARGTLNVLEACRKSRSLRRFVLLSSGHVYGAPRYSPIDEAHPLQPNNPYGASKMAAEAMVAGYHAAYGIPTTILRAFNVYGPGQAERFLIPSIIQQLRSGAAPRLGDGRPVRDFTYVSDFVELLAKAAQPSGPSGEVFNVGTGRGASVAEVAETLMRIAGVAGSPVFEEARFREGDVMELLVENRKARRAFGWAPRVDLAKGLEMAWAASAPRREAKV